MVTITLPDGKNLKFSKEVTGLDVAEKFIIQGYFVFESNDA